MLPSLGLEPLLQPMRFVSDMSHALVHLALAAQARARAGAARGQTRESSGPWRRWTWPMAYVTSSLVGIAAMAASSPTVARRLRLTRAHPWWMLIPRLALAASLAGALRCIWRLASQVASPGQARPRSARNELAFIGALVVGAAMHPACGFLLLALALFMCSATSSARACAADALFLTDASLLVTCMGAVRIPGALAYHRAVWSQDTPRCGRLPYAPAICISTDARAAMWQLVLVSALAFVKTAPTFSSLRSSRLLGQRRTMLEATGLGLFGALVLSMPTGQAGAVDIDEDVASSQGISWAAGKGVALLYVHSITGRSCR